MRETLRTLRGVIRSLRIYYGGQRGRAAMDRLYGRFVKPGDLVFDVGSHVGDRIAAFRRVGCRVVACVMISPAVTMGTSWRSSTVRLARRPAAASRRFCKAALADSSRLACAAPPHSSTRSFTFVQRPLACSRALST